MRRKIIAGNWKMYGTRASVDTLLTEIKAGLDDSDCAEVIVFPSYVYIPSAQQHLTNSLVKWGAQNMYPALEGAVTGEISATMLKEYGCDYVILGHSERRTLFKETDDQILAKFLFAIEQGITPILCVGETLAQRENEQTFEVIAQQLDLVLQHAPSTLASAIVAYEPVWAIGTGLTATPEQAQKVHQFIRQQAEKRDKTLAEQLRILYGGSVKRSNANDLFAMPDIDGGLIGGASLNAQEFLGIVKLCN